MWKSKKFQLNDWIQKCEIKNSDNGKKFGVFVFESGKIGSKGAILLKSGNLDFKFTDWNQNSAI